MTSLINNYASPEHTSITESAPNIESAALDVQEDDDIPPPPPVARPTFSGRIYNTKEEIEHVNMNRNTKVILQVISSDRTTWYYSQNKDGEFFYIVSKYLESGRLEEIIKLNKPLSATDLSVM